ncbi:MAG: hypothetical protein KC776_30135 [Myxococcales bacterium]|nr:hypothetical protein [Myxococcales bacterium]MCB9577132.1 hypothetical protein [Polyangiaceae bacterium]
MARWKSSILLSAIVAISSPAFADAPSAEDIKAAADEFDQGKRSFRDKEWVAAAEHFEAADRHAPSAVVLELAMRAREKAGQLDRAAVLAALILDLYPKETDKAKAAGKILDRADKQLQRVRVRCDQPCDLVVGTKLVHGQASSARTLFLEPGEHTVRAGWSGGRSQSEKLTAKKGGKSELSFTAPAEPENPPTVAPETPTPTSPTPTTAPAPPTHDTPPPEPGSGMSPAVFFVGAGLTAVAGGVTIWSGIDTQNNPGKDKVREDCAGLGTDCPTYQDGLDKQRRTNVLIGVTAGLGVVTGVIGAFFTDWSGGDSAPKKSAAVEPWVGVGAVGARGRF